MRFSYHRLPMEKPLDGNDHLDDHLSPLSPKKAFQPFGAPSAALLLLIFLSMNRQQSNYSLDELMQSFFPFMDAQEKQGINKILKISRVAQDVHCLGEDEPCCDNGCGMPPFDRNMELLKTMQQYCDDSLRKPLCSVTDSLCKYKDMLYSVNELKEFMNHPPGGLDGLGCLMRTLSPFGINMNNNISQVLSMAQMLNGLGGFPRF